MQMIWMGAVLLFLGPPAFAQQEPGASRQEPEAPRQQSAAPQKVQGRISESGSSKPLGLVHVINKRTGDWTLSGYQGEFEIMAANGDVLAFVKDGYLPREVSLEASGDPLEILLSKKPEPPATGSELLPEVTVYGKSYLADSLQLRQEYERYFPSPPPTLKDAIGSDGSLDLNTFISRMMTPWDREFSERLLEYEQKKYIDKVFTEERIRQAVDIPDGELKEFMRTCRPSYNFLVTATEYDLIGYIQDAYKLYRSAKYGETLRGNRRGGIPDAGRRRAPAPAQREKPASARPE